MVPSAHDRLWQSTFVSSLPRETKATYQYKVSDEELKHKTASLGNRLIMDEDRTKGPSVNNLQSPISDPEFMPPHRPSTHGKSKDLEDKAVVGVADDEERRIAGTGPSLAKPSIEDLGERIFRPVQYFYELEVVLCKIEEHSTLSLHGKGPLADLHEFYRAPPVFPEEGRLGPNEPWPDSYYLEFCNQLPEDYPSRLFLVELLECRNVSLHPFSNLKLLQSNRFCHEILSVLIYDRVRPNVVKLEPIHH